MDLAVLDPSGEAHGPDVADRLGAGGACERRPARVVHRRRRGRVHARIAGALAAAVVSAVLGACSDPYVPTATEPAPEPTLFWLNGQPDGPLEDDPWVQKIRAVELAELTAYSSGDFTDPGLARLRGDGRVQSMAEGLAGSLREGTVTVQLGPRPFTPLVVQEPEGDRGARVYGCGDHVERHGQQGYGFESVSWPAPFRYELTEDDEGRVSVSGQGDDRGWPDEVLLPDGTELTLALCRAVTIHRARLDPAPDLQRLRQIDPDILDPTAAPR